MKDHLIFDTTSATTIADTDSVGAYLRASDGTLLTHTDVGGKKALDVRVAEGINVEVDLDAADDSVESWTHDGTGNAIGSTTGALHVSDAGGSLTVDASNLDIRDLVFATDKVDISGSTNVGLDAATLAALESITVQNGAGAAAVNIQDGGNSITVDAVDLDIRDLVAATDSVSSYTKDGAGTSITSTVAGPDTGLDVNIINSLTVNDAALANTAIASDAETLDVANTAQNAVASPLAARKYLYIYNNDNQKMYVGESGVSAASGFPISPGAYMEFRAGAAIDIEFVSAKLNHEIRTLELS